MLSLELEVDLEELACRKGQERTEISIYKLDKLLERIIIARKTDKITLGIGINRQYYERKTNIIESLWIYEDKKCIASAKDVPYDNREILLKNGTTPEQLSRTIESMLNEKNIEKKISSLKECETICNGLGQTLALFSTQQARFMDSIDEYYRRKLYP